MNLLTTLDLCWLHYYVMFDDLSEINKKKKKKTENRFSKVEQQQRNILVTKNRQSKNLPFIETTSIEKPLE